MLAAERYKSVWNMFLLCTSAEVYHAYTLDSQTNT